MRALSFVAAVCAIMALGSAAAGAAEPCPSALSVNNPAFGAPRSCATVPAKPAAKATKSAPTTDKKATKVTTEDGRTVYRYGDDTTISVRGYVSVDIGTGGGNMRR